MLKARLEEGIAVTQLIRKFSLLQLFSKSQGRNLTRNKIETRFLDKVQHSHKEYVFGGLYFLFIFWLYQRDSCKGYKIPQLSNQF